MRILKRLFGHVRPYWKPLLLTAIAMLLETGLSLVPPLFQKSIIDGVLGTGDLSQLWKLIAGLGGVYILLQVLSAENDVRHVLVSLKAGVARMELPSQKTLRYARAGCEIISFDACCALPTTLEQAAIRPV